MALAVLMPIVAAMGGNAGMQTLTVVIRALAIRDLTRSNAPAVLLKELIVGGINSSVLIVVGGIVALLWFGSVHSAWCSAPR